MHDVLPDALKMCFITSARVRHTACTICELYLPARRSAIGHFDGVYDCINMLIADQTRREKAQPALSRRSVSSCIGRLTLVLGIEISQKSPPPAAPA